MYRENGSINCPTWVLLGYIFLSTRYQQRYVHKKTPAPGFYYWPELLINLPSRNPSGSALLFPSLFSIVTTLRDP